VGTFDPGDPPALGFDHRGIVTDALEGDGDGD
jgi:hypothetical protein